MFKFCVTVLLFFPMIMLAQTVSEPAFYNIVAADCDSKAFTKTEILPSLKISAEAYADSLMAYLRSKNVVIKNSAVPYRFFLTMHSQILEIEGVNKRAPAIVIVGDAISHFKHLLKPAVQNKRPVCSFVTFMVVFENDGIRVDILQGF